MKFYSIKDDHKLPMPNSTGSTLNSTKMVMVIFLKLNAITLLINF